MSDDTLGPWLTQQAAERERAGLHRSPRPRTPVGSGLINMASNDYLGLSADPRVIAGAQAAAATYGGGATASRLVAGTLAVHEALESDLAEFMGYPAALVFSSGYLANVAAITALVGRGDLIISDAGSHASLIDGCRLSRARVVVTPRGDVAAVRQVLAERSEQRALVVTDSIYSIDGAIAPVDQMYEAARAHGAVLVVDEAHALGVRGPGGRGVLAQYGLSGAPDLVTTTVLSKSLGAQGGVVLGSSAVREHLINTARPFIFDTGLNPAAVGAAQAALTVLRGDPELPTRAQANARALAQRIGADTPDSAVVSYIIGDPAAALATAERCRAAGVLVGCFRPPSVPVGTSRLRMTVPAHLDLADIKRAAAVITAATADVEHSA